MKSFLRRLALTSGRAALTLVIVAVALVAGRYLWVYYQDEPWTRDGRVRADVVTIAPDVSGLVSEVLVHDNQQVKRGDVLFRIDPDRFKLALEQADAAAANRKAQMDESAREEARYERLTQLSVSQETQEQRLTNLEAAASAYRQALADRGVAELNLKRAAVTSTVDGTVTNVLLEPGDYVPGDRVRIRLMGEPRELTGRVESIAAGIADRERSDSPDLLANINPTFNWVRLAQRVPVRVKPETVPPGVQLVLGRTATVSVEPDTASDR
jgi:multidrug resistance efflux pump